MSIFYFGVHFMNKQSGRMHFKTQREQQGVICKRHEGTEYY
jgi:hypothetical protein